MDYNPSVAECLILIGQKVLFLAARQIAGLYERTRSNTLSYSIAAVDLDVDVTRFVFC